MTPLGNLKYLHQKANALQEWHINSVDVVAWVSIKAALESIPVLESTITRQSAALKMAVDGLESCIYHTSENRDSEDQEWCPSCGEILSATNMRGELRKFSHQDDCKLEAALAACREALKGGE